MDLSRCSIDEAANGTCNIFGLTTFDNMCVFELARSEIRIGDQDWLTPNSSAI